MKNIKLSTFFIVTLVSQMFCNCLMAEESAELERNEVVEQIIQSEDLEIDKQVIVQDETTLNVDKQKCYDTLGINATATEREVERAYYKKVDKENAWLLYYKEQQQQWDEINKKHNEATKKYPSDLLKKEFGGKKIIVYGEMKESYIPTIVPEYHSVYYKDQYGRTYIKRTSTNVYDKKGYASSYKNLAEIRHAFQKISGKTLERIKLDPQELNTDDLDQKRIYNYASQSNSNLEGLLAIIHDERRKNNLEEVDDFVVGENYQDMSLLSLEDKIKAETCLTQRLEKERPQRYAEYGMNAAIAGGIVTTISLIARAILLQE